MEPQVVSRQRVIDHGEVYTRPREVNAMLDLVAHECERIDSRFLEPACGTGNFLIEVLRRKLATVAARHRKNRRGWERDAVLAVTSLYGIDLLPDNVAACRGRLAAAFDAEYARLFDPAGDDATAPAVRGAARFILSQNVVCGDALSFLTPAGAPIVLPEWSPVNGASLKRRDFRFDHLLGHAEARASPLFSDLGDEAYLPEPVADHPPVHYLKLTATASPTIEHYQASKKEQNDTH